MNAIRAPLDPKESKKRKRERLAIVVLSALFIALAVFEFKLTKVSTSLPLVNSIFFFGLLNINILLLASVIWLIARNVGKLFFERRSHILGARLKTKLVVAFSAFSATPTIVLFIISALYINSSFDKWFSLRIQNTLQGSLEITNIFYKNTEQTARHFAEHIAREMAKRFPAKSPRGKIPPGVKSYLDEQVKFLALHAVEFYTGPFDDRLLLQGNQSPADHAQSYPFLPLDVLERAFRGEPLSVIHQIGTGDLIRTVVPIRGKISVPGVVVVDAYVPVSIVNKVDQISTVFDDYKGTNPLKYPIKTAYFVILIMMTLVIIFVAIWLGIYLARELTVPVENLVRGVQKVGAGDLDVVVERTGQDEISTLVDAFNQMTKHLKDNSIKLSETTKDLENRTLELETVLANIGSGVLVVGPDGIIRGINRAASALLEIPLDRAEGRMATDVFVGQSKPLAQFIERCRQRQIEQHEAQPQLTQHHLTSHNGGTRSLAVVSTILKHGETLLGLLVVIDDMTHLLKAQREVAWREVARRIAHEIKNPLTPIKLSAQRLERQLGSIPGREGALVKECTSTIVRHTDELKDMVNEFSNFARFPEISPSRNSLNEAIEEIIKLYSQAHPAILFKLSLDKRMPLFEFDRDQIKRVVMNLIDNAVSAVRGAGEGVKSGAVAAPVIETATHYNENLKIAAIVMSDNGPGMAEEIRSRVFEPYFSTKRDGTGLGLAIAKRIVNDHDGFIRVSSEAGRGTQFWIELPTSFRRIPTGIHSPEIHS